VREGNLRRRTTESTDVEIWEGIVESWLRLHHSLKLHNAPFLAASFSAVAPYANLHLFPLFSLHRLSWGLGILERCDVGGASAAKSLYFPANLLPKLRDGKL